MKYNMQKINIGFIGLCLWCLTASSQQPMVGLASPIEMQPGQTIVYLNDYFPLTNDELSIVYPAKLNQVSIKNSEIMLTGNLERTIDNLHFANKDGQYDILIKRSRKINSKEVLELENPVFQLGIKGSFNNWVTDTAILKPIGLLPTKKWTATNLLANEGYQAYKLVSNGKELNPIKTKLVDNGMGGTNAIMVFGNPDAVSPKLSTIQNNDGRVTIQILNATHYAAYWNNQLVGSQNLKQNWLAKNEPLKANAKIEITIPNSAKLLARSYLRVYAANDTKIGNDLLIPLSFGKVVTQTDELNRTDLQTQIMYFMMVDRFANGDPNNDPPKLDSVLPKAQYYGGDLLGINQQLQATYFQTLGTNTLWLSPISQNPKGAWGYWNKQVTTKFSAYHGYWPTSYSKVDSRFGNDSIFKAVISTAHQQKMNVILDFVAHHVHVDHPLYKKNPTWVTPLYLPDGSMNTERWDDHRLTTWFDTFLPTLDLQKEEVREVVSDSILFWVKNYDLDGFRHDASKHVPEEFWRMLSLKIKQQKATQQNPTFFQIGETYGSPDLIHSYVNSGQMDAQFDFNLYDAAVGAFGFQHPNQSAQKYWEQLGKTLNESFSYYGWHHLMGNISGNQDRPRFASLADGSLNPAEDTKLAGWTRNISNANELGYNRMAQMMAFNMTIPGVPVIYYGDEFAMPGGNDPDNRRMMQFEGYDHNQQMLINKVKKLTALRKSNMCLLYGEFELVNCGPEFFGYKRSYFGQEILVVFSKQGGSAKLMLDKKSGKKIATNLITNKAISVNNNTLDISLANDDFAIIELK